jgi:hypothetical protein
MRIEKISAETLKVASMRNSVRFYGPGPQPCESWQVATVGLQTQRPCGWRMSFRGNCAAPRGNPNIRKLLLERYRRFESQSLRHTVWVAEKSGCITARIAENRRNFAGLAFKPYRRKCPVEARGQVFWRFSLEATRTVPFPATPSGECNAITNR